MKAKLINKKQLNHKVYDYEFEVGEGFSFLPGQFVLVKVDGNTTRPYSIYSNYKVAGKFSLAVSVGHEGVGANHFKNLNVGDEIEFMGPMGNKLLPNNILDKLIFIITGTGITHVLAFLYQLEDMGYKGKIDLYWGLNNDKDMYFKDLLDYFSGVLNFNYHMQYSVDSGRVDKLLLGFTDKEVTYYICGHPKMMVDMSKGLENNGISKDNIHF